MILQQPWARLVCEGVFPALVRSMATKARGRVAIIAKGMDPDALVDGHPPNRNEFPHPALVGYVHISDCIKVPGEQIVAILRRNYGNTFADFYPRHYLPHRFAVYLWTLSNPRKLRRPRKIHTGKSLVWSRL